MTTRFLLLVVLAAVGNLPQARAQLGAASANRTASWRQSSESDRLQSLYDHYRHSTSTSCSVSRAALLAQTLSEAGPKPYSRPEVRMKLAVLARHLTLEERKELHRIRFTEANYRKHQERLAKKPPTAGGTDRPRDPWLDQLARERAERQHPKR